ncbi:SusD/RagB family nutrient-binding outer membrane lipoprotein [Chitinophaga nivalis]|uniref:SusD/RagB family nutrient-binding outer membrane lipoprotein n=1 Tax=Chitinophaga nivalis TaxID=2991709 RepID=A0ABT3IFQ7_9BACT|nr:SusD/RagB family nutrient-binding outer membrane lipoprotein [Chitinophaga nivalis]MCW3467513.1 SusD/RagB family nutrient-binding outer membrane lipoprotein [Chitinophaga nivalis]MCW3482795.1 SusD/RagB family nutrient-binding outer membrane lipoprotein [Chitinophaga nivalis]
MQNRTNIFLLIIVTLFSGYGCTKNFDSINKNPFDFDEDELVADHRLMGEPLSQAQLNLLIYNDPPTAQLQQNLNADVFSGYMMPPTPFEGNINNTNYGLLYFWNNKPWLIAYAYVMKSCDFAQEKARGKYPDFYAWAQILKVEAMHRVSDIYGPIIYSHYGVINPDKSVDYDSQQEAYYHFFTDLDSAINVLTRYIDSNAQQRFSAFDLVYNGDYSRWVKFANTLRLRLAIRIYNVDPEKARKEGEAALRHPLGLLQDPQDLFAVNISPVTHPLNIMCYTWADLRMSAPMESILTGYKDPRLPHYFVPTDAGTNTYHGIRNGINISAKEEYSGFSQLVRFENRILFMTVAEAWFLKAEAALHNWKNAGNAANNYVQGIQASFRQYNIPNVNDYINNSTNKPNPYVDPRNPENNIPPGSPYLSKITIRWDEQATEAEKLERIITQKWIAMFPEGQEAWSEFRRTGYPKLFPVVINNSGNTIATEKFIRRLPIPQLEITTNPKAVYRARLTLGGEDTGGTPLWWDTRP